ncbi:hypothetical protein DLREEDagr8_09820 [Dongia sp. agr-C8]
MLSEILPRDRDCAFNPLTAVNIAPRMLMEGLALGNLASGVGRIKQLPGQLAEARFPKGYQMIDVAGPGRAAECARSKFGKNCCWLRFALSEVGHDSPHMAQSLRTDSRISAARTYESA